MGRRRIRCNDAVPTHIISFIVSTLRIFATHNITSKQFTIPSANKFNFANLQDLPKIKGKDAMGEERFDAARWQSDQPVREHNPIAWHVNKRLRTRTMAADSRRGAAASASCESASWQHCKHQACQHVAREPLSHWRYTHTHTHARTLPEVN